MYLSLNIPGSSSPELAGQGSLVVRLHLRVSCSCHFSLDPSQQVGIKHQGIIHIFWRGWSRRGFSQAQNLVTWPQLAAPEAGIKASSWATMKSAKLLTTSSFCHHLLGKSASTWYLGPAALFSTCLPSFWLVWSWAELYSMLLGDPERSRIRIITLTFTFLGKWFCFPI